MKTPDTIHVYSDGKMSKVNFKNLLFGKKLKYVYVDKVATPASGNNSHLHSGGALKNSINRFKPNNK